MTPNHYSPAAERNAAAIAAALRARLPAQGDALEIASGTGQHAAALAAVLPHWRWQPSDWQADAFDSISQWAALAGAANVQPAVLLDVRAPQWPDCAPHFGRSFDVVFCANMLHIAPWPCCAGLVQGAARHLRAGGRLVLYGPFVEAAVPTAASNQAFDADLKSRDPAWGLRTLEAVRQTALAAGLALLRREPMPANNLLLTFGHSAEDCA